VGCGGVELSPDFVEVKRMYVRDTARGKGVAQALLQRIQMETRAARLTALRLETGDRQEAAIRLYTRAGFVRCPASGAYAALAREAIAASSFSRNCFDVTQVGVVIWNPALSAITRKLR